MHRDEAWTHASRVDRSTCRSAPSSLGGSRSPVAGSASERNTRPNR